MESRILAGLLILLWGTGLVRAADDSGYHLRFLGGDRVTLGWDALPDAGQYALYRGEITKAPSLEIWYTHSCFQTELSETTTKDFDLPRPGEAYYYLISALDRFPWGLSDRGLGTDSFGRERPDFSCGVRVFLDPSATGTKTGKSWENAYTSLLDALTYKEGEGWPSEIWVKGPINEEIRWWDDVHTSILGGFSGNETHQWERDPVRNVTVWNGHYSGGGIASFELRLDGFHLKGTKTPFFHLVNDFVGTHVVLRNCIFDGSSQPAVLFRTAEVPCRWEIDQCRFENMVHGALYLLSWSGTLDSRITRSTFSGTGGTVIKIARHEVMSMGWLAPDRVEIANNVIQGGDIGIQLVADQNYDYTYEPSRMNAVIVSNVISDVGTGIDLLAESEYCPGPDPSSMAATLKAEVVANTIRNFESRGIRCQAKSLPGVSRCFQPEDEVRCEVTAWDNLITNGPVCLEENRDNPAQYVNSIVQAIGNDLYQCPTLFLQNGTMVLNSVDQVNAVPGNRDNFSLDPLYQGPSDFHLSPHSPAVDRGHPERPHREIPDIDGQFARCGQVSPGSVCISLPDVGADERNLVLVPFPPGPTP